MISLLKNPRDRAERMERVHHYLASLGLKHYRAIVFDSVARADPTAKSDTDLLIVDMATVRRCDHPPCVERSYIRPDTEACVLDRCLNRLNTHPRNQSL